MKDLNTLALITHTLNALKKEYGAAQAEQQFTKKEEIKAQTASSIVRILAAHKALGEITLGDLRAENE